MKKNSFLKVLLGMYLLVVILSWIIPAGSYTNGTYASAGVAAVGVVNLFRLPIMTLQTFIQYTLVFLSIGLVYGVLNKTGVYDNICKGIAKRWKGKEKLLLIIVSIIFALIGSLTGLSTYAFLLVPFVGAVLMLAGVDKMSVMLSTVGALLVGEAASIFGFSGAGYVINVLGYKLTDELITKVILFVLLTGLYIFFVQRKMEVSKAKVEEIPLLTEDNKNSKKKLPLIITSLVFLVLILLGMYNWYYSFGIEVFNNLDTKLNSISIVSKLINGSTALGYWGNYELATVNLIFACVIAWLYNVKLKDMADGMKDGIKKIFKVAFYATICNIIFTVMLTGTSNIYATILNSISKMSTSYSIPVTSLIGATGSIFFNDFYYVLYNAAPILSGYEAVYYPVTGVLVTGIHGILMMLLPTSIILIAGLKYFEISYAEWFKRIWKYLLEALAVLMLIVIIVTILI